MKVPAMIAAELRRLTSTKMGVLALLALMLVPILYGGLYLWANQDPYSKFGDVPVALVVADDGVAASAGQPAVNYGDRVADELRADGTFRWQRMTARQADAALHDGVVDFTVTLPHDFSAALTSVAGTAPRQADIALATNDANNYLASTIGGQAVEKIRRQVAELVGRDASGRLLTAISDIRGNLVDAADGAGALADGAGTAYNGARALQAGTARLADGAQALAAGARGVADGAAQLTPGAQQLASGAHQVADGTRALAGYADEAGAAARAVTDALPQARHDVTVALQQQGLTPQQIDAVLARLDPLAQKARAGDARVQATVGQIDRLASGAAQVATGADRLASGAQQVSLGSARLAAGADDAAAGAARLTTGAATLTDGLATLRDGAATLHTRLHEGATALPQSTADLRTQQAKVIANPVHVSSAKVAAAANYGAGLAPFFAALAGWIGIYALFLIVKPVSRRAVTALRSPLRVTAAGWLTPAILGGIQMLGLFGVLALALGFGFANPWGTLGVMVAASLCYTAIILALNVWLGSVGQFLGLVFMVLQLVVAGGTFPWQTLPAPLAALHRVLPMGFVVDAMRQLMYGGQLARAGADLGVLALWTAAGLALAALGVTRMTHRRTLRDLQPSLIG